MPHSRPSPCGVRATRQTESRDMQSAGFNDASQTNCFVRDIVGGVCGRASMARRICHSVCQSQVAYCCTCRKTTAADVCPRFFFDQTAKPGQTADWDTGYPTDISRLPTRDSLEPGLPTIICTPYSVQTDRLLTAEPSGRMLGPF